MTRKLLPFLCVMCLAVPGTMIEPTEAQSLDGPAVLRIEGSTTVGPIAEAFREVFKSKYSDVNFTISKPGSGVGAAALIDGRCDIAMMSRFMKPTEFKKAVDKGVLPVAHVVAMDGVCVIVNRANPIEKITMAQLKDIYTGKLTNWSQVDSSCPDAKIGLITRDSASGTGETFRKLVLGGDKEANPEEINSNNAVLEAVKNTRGAIGYIGLGYVNRDIKVLPVNDVYPTPKTVKSGKYPIARPLFLFTNGYPKLGSLVHEFVTYHLSFDGHKRVKGEDFVPVTDY